MRLDNIDECIAHLPIERLQAWVNGLRSGIMIELAIRFVKSDGGPRPRVRMSNPLSRRVTVYILN